MRLKPRELWLPRCFLRVSVGRNAGSSGVAGGPALRLRSGFCVQSRPPRNVPEPCNIRESRNVAEWPSWIRLKCFARGILGGLICQRHASNRDLVPVQYAPSAFGIALQGHNPGVGGS